MDEIVQFDFPTDSPKIIKVIGVGGGGGNAVNHMYREGIHDVTFVLCNTDNQALAESPVPVKLQLGRSITQGLGAGNRPERARDAAEESIDDIKEQLNDGTKMVFITAGMGGGTGTGAAPVIARIAKEMDILTVGIVTIPFIFEGEKKIIQALDGVPFHPGSYLLDFYLHSGTGRRRTYRPARRCPAGHQQRAPARNICRPYLHECFRQGR